VVLCSLLSSVFWLGAWGALAFVSVAARLRKKEEASSRRNQDNFGWKIIVGEFEHTPGSRKFSLASRGDWLWHFQGRPGLVDLSKTLSGTFFRRVHPGSEMAGQNGKNGLFCQNDQKDPNGLVF